MKIAPSLLSCDFANMGKDIIRIDKAGADYMHLDIMDGHFVPNITFGAPIVKAVRPLTKVPFDVHLMIENPIDFIDDFVSAGADIITFHTEAKSSIEATIKKIKKAGVKPGLVIKPQTPASEVFPYLKDLYMVLVMTVEPGFGGQSFMENMIPKIKEIKKEIKKQELSVLIEADGGINESTVTLAARAGIDIAVSGTGVFKAENPAKAIQTLKKLADS